MHDRVATSRTPSLEARTASIQRTPLFRGLSPEQRAEVAGYARERSVRRKQTFFQEGAPSYEAFVLSSGRVKLTQLAANGQEVILRLVGAGEVLVGIGLAEGAIHAHSAVAIEDSTALAWEQRILDELLTRFAPLHKNALRITAERLRNLEERYTELATERVPQRLARTLFRIGGQLGRTTDGGVLVSLSREELAQMLGTTPFSVSRLVSEWESRGILRCRREAVLIDDMSALIAIAAETSSAP